MRFTRSLTGAAVVGLALTLAACSGPSDSGLSYEDSPLSKYFEASFGGDMSVEEQQKQIDEQTRVQEELMAECMKEEGFEYIPDLDNGGVIISSEDDVVWEPDDKDWVAQYGYGMVNSPYSDSMMTPSEEEYVDPNADYVMSLSESEQTAYYETAYGAPMEGDGSEAEVIEYNWEDAGCQGWAQHEAGGEDPWQAAEFAPLLQKMQELWETSQNAPELAGINAKWSACMEDGGQPGFETQPEAAESISDAQNKIYEEVSLASADGGADGEITPEDMIDPNDTPEMKELGEKEIALALVDLECREKTSYTEESLKVQFALEEKFIADNKADLEAFKAAAEQSE